MMKSSIYGLALGLAVCSIASAATVTDSLDSGANFVSHVGGTATPPDGSNTVAYGFNYAAYGIPAAPHSTDGSTVGIQLKNNIFGGIQSGISIAPANYALAGSYTVQFDVWANYSSLGTSTSTVVGGGLGPSAQTQFGGSGAANSVLFGAVRDNLSSTAGDYRIYATGGQVAVGSAVYAAPADAGQAGRRNDYRSAYYTAAFPSVTTTNTPQTSGATTLTNTVTTAAGTPGMAWHTVLISNDGTNITWTIDSTLIATVPVTSTGVAASTNLFFTSYDTSASSSSSAAGNFDSPTVFNFDVFDNLIINGGVTVTPEPASLSLLGLAGVGLLGRRRRA